MTNILLISHGWIAESILDSSELICGEQIKVETLGLKLDTDLDAFKNTIEEKIKAATTDGDLVVMTDLMYGTPFNMVSSLMSDYEFAHFSGMNLPVFLELVVTRHHLDYEVVVNNIRDMAPTTIVYVNDLIGGDAE